MASGPCQLVWPPAQGFHQAAPNTALLICYKPDITHAHMLCSIPASCVQHI